MQANLHTMMAAGLAPFLAQFTPQQQAQLLNMQLNTRVQSGGPTVAAPPVAQAQPKQENQAALLSSMTTIVENLAQTVRDLSALPGATHIISPDMATVVQHIAAIKAPPAQRPVTPVNTKDFNNAGHSNGPDSMAKQRPVTPPALLRMSAQHSPTSPGMPAQPSPTGIPAGPAPQPMQGVLGPVLGLHAPQQSAEVPKLAPHPVKAEQLQGLQPLPTAGSLTLSLAETSSDSDEERPSTKRQRHDGSKASADSAHGMLMAQHALAAVMGLKQQGLGPLPSLPALSTAPGALNHAALSAMPFAMPVMMPLNLRSPVSTGPQGAAGFAMPGLQQPKLQMAGHRTASVHEMMEAAEILTGLHNNIHSPMASSEDAHSEPWSPHGMEEQAYGQGWGRPQAAAAAAAGKPPAKPRAKRPAAKKTGQKRRQNLEKLHFQAEAEHDVSEETKAALLMMWAQHNESLPVFCVNHSSGVRADGTFKIIDGKRKIVVADGTIMDPVDFEKAGDRATTRNWQLSICVAGLHTRPGSKTDLKLGHATRILGVHNPVPGLPASPAAL